MRRRLHNLAMFLRRFGWRRSAGLLVLWSARQLIGYRRAIVYRLPLESVAVPKDCKDLCWTYITGDRVAAVLQPDTKPTDQPDAARRWFVGALGGVQCYASVSSITGFRIPERVQVVFADPTDVYVGDCVTHPDYRGRGIYPCGLLELARRFETEGMKSLYLFVEADNLPSTTAVRKAGFAPLAVSTVWRLGPLSRRRLRFVGIRNDRLPAPNWRVEVLR